MFSCVPIRRVCLFYILFCLFFCCFSYSPISKSHANLLAATSYFSLTVFLRLAAMSLFWICVCAVPHTAIHVYIIWVLVLNVFCLFALSNVQLEIHSLYIVYLLHMHSHDCCEYIFSRFKKTNFDVHWLAQANITNKRTHTCMLSLAWRDI